MFPAEKAIKSPNDPEKYTVDKIDIHYNVGHLSTVMNYFVVDHPYIAITDDGGAFKLADIPPGTYKVVAWHESWKVTATDKDGRPSYDKPVMITKDVTIPAKGETKLDLELR